MEDRCKSINIRRSGGKDNVLCQSSDSDHLQHQNDLKLITGFMYRGTRPTLENWKPKRKLRKKMGKKLEKEKSTLSLLKTEERKEHTSVLEELQHFKDSLLRDTNRGRNQQRLIDKMKAERWEIICVQAQQRHELGNDLCQAQKKVSDRFAQMKVDRPLQLYYRKLQGSNNLSSESEESALSTEYL
ncbi:hypothetical protein AWC38_SpisGene22260 [Stylophora pistillata]|uniref:Uncharacterized protein n=1 Tax=Stylophora pistillata TaxID=50429 RepID=A0A2B4RBN7_STYPI|nr:hypothetical protein AWC38_SpisGene22260 [Stylophora pistillata]